MKNICFLYDNIDIYEPPLFVGEEIKFVIFKSLTETLEPNSTLISSIQRWVKYRTPTSLYKFKYVPVARTSDKNIWHGLDSYGNIIDDKKLIELVDVNDTDKYRTYLIIRQSDLKDYSFYSHKIYDLGEQDVPDDIYIISLKSVKKRC